LWHRFNTLVDEVLTDLIPAFTCQLSSVLLIPVWELFDVLFWRLPAVLNRCEIRARVAVEVVLKVIVFFPLAYDVAFAWAVARIAILL
jgi:hypothetical protein